MQIIIPMSGFGERFRRAGYINPKPLIVVDGKPIIQHVVEMFPGEKDFKFICNADHLANPDYKMREILKKICPTGEILEIAPHKLGPIHAVQQIQHLLDPDAPALVNYCDFTCYWDWNHFKNFVKSSKCAGAIPAYRGFHPHMLGSTNYAHLQEEGGWITDIQEKKSYSKNRMDDYASSGTYYFASTSRMISSFKKIVESNINYGGEFYVSLAYLPLLDEKLPIAVYPLQHFLQWGNPDDLEEYSFWSDTFKHLLSQKLEPPKQGSIIVPMAGLGQRYADQGYDEIKPLIPVSGEAMAIQAIMDLPNSKNQCFILRKDMPKFEKIYKKLRENFPSAIIEVAPSVTEGQACSALIGMNALNRTAKETSNLYPITFGACDNGVLYDRQKFDRLLQDPSVDIIVWGSRGHASAVRKPSTFGWIIEKEHLIEKILVKDRPPNPANDPCVTGTFTFKKFSDAEKVIKKLISKNERVNGEFYLDSCINIAINEGLRCIYFEVDSFISWGMPDDLRTFEYWQSFFHKWHQHPYSLDLDPDVKSSEIEHLKIKYARTIPAKLNQNI